MIPGSSDYIVKNRSFVEGCNGAYPGYFSLKFRYFLLNGLSVGGRKCIVCCLDAELSHTVEHGGNFSESSVSNLTQRNTVLSIDGTLA